MIFENKRSEAEIIGQLLTLAKKDAKKTHLMYKTNLCYNHFVDYMNFLIEKNFIAKKKRQPIGFTYYTTKKGKELLEIIENLQKVTEN